MAIPGFQAVILVAFTWASVTMQSYLLCHGDNSIGKEIIMVKSKQGYSIKCRLHRDFKGVFCGDTSCTWGMGKGEKGS